MLHFLLYTSQLDAVCLIRILKICGFFRVFNFSPNKKNCCLSSFVEIRVRQLAPNVGKDTILGSYGLESLCYLQKLRHFSPTSKTQVFFCVKPRSLNRGPAPAKPTPKSQTKAMWNQSPRGVLAFYFWGHVFLCFFGLVVPPNLNTMLVRLDPFPNFSGENEKNIWNHHLACFLGGWESRKNRTIWAKPKQDVLEARTS